MLFDEVLARSLSMRPPIRFAQRDVFARGLFEVSRGVGTDVAAGGFRDQQVERALGIVLRQRTGVVQGDAVFLSQIPCDDFLARAPLLSCLRLRVYKPARPIASASNALEFS